MTHAYDENYLDDAMCCLAEAFEYACLDLGQEADEFSALFVSSKSGRSFEVGEPRVVAGMSGEELVLRLLSETGVLTQGPSRTAEIIRLSGKVTAVEYSSLPTTRLRVEKGPEYWAGWVYAYAQWETSWNFKTIFQAIPAHDALVLYPTLHEAPEGKFVSVLRKRCQQHESETRLAAVRRARGITQRSLAEQAGVSVRSVQMWEQRNKDINKAQAASLTSLARVLGCETSALLETA